MKAEMQANWNHLTHQVGLKKAADLGRLLLESWSEPHRSFHTLQHLQEVISVLGKLSTDPRLMLAAWFHDAIYEPTRTDNEARSAAWARDALIAQGAAQADVDFIRMAILETAGHCTRLAEVEALLDADLSILGAPASRYAEYRKSIREEYREVPDSDFRAGRSLFLENMLQRPTIYRTPQGSEWFERQARENLRMEVADLESSSEGREA